MPLFRPERRSLSVESVWGSFGSSRSSLTGERVDFATVIGLDAVAGAVGLLSDIVSMVPFHAYRDVDGVASKLPTQPQILENPSPSVRPVAWKAQAIVSQALWGNLYGLVIDEDRLGYPTSVEVADPAQVACREAPPARPQWSYAGREIDASRLIHSPGRYVRPGSVLGMSPLDANRDTWGLAQSARRYGAQWFRDGAHPSAILSTPVDKSLTQEQAQTMKDRFMAALRKKREPAVLSGGVTYTPIQGNPSDSQMIEVEDQIIGRVARVIGVPAEMIGGSAGSKSSVTYANREQRAVDLLTYTVDPYLVRLEELFTSCLPRGQYVKAARGALLRTDLLTRYRAHDIAIRGGFATPNERRALEDEPPLPEGGDEALWPPYATSVQATTAQGGDQ